LPGLTVGNRPNVRHLYPRFEYCVNTHLGAFFTAAVQRRNPGAIVEEKNKETMKIFNQTGNQTHQ